MADKGQRIDWIGEGTPTRPWKDIGGEHYVPAVAPVGPDGESATGTKITAATMPAGGAGMLGWLSAAWYELTVRLPATLGIKTAAASLSVVPASDAVHKVGVIANITATFNRPADTTAYAAGDLIANNTTANSVTPMTFANVVRSAAGAVSIIKARLTKTGTTLPASGIRLHLYSTLPTVTNGDNGAFLSNQAATYLGCFEFGAAFFKAFSDGNSCNGITQTGYPITVDLPSGSDVYGLLESIGVTTSASSETYTVTLEVEQE